MLKEIVLAGLAGGRWQDLEAGAARGIAAGPERVTREQLREAATAFRYAHRLLAAEELRAWLAARGLSQEDWYGHLRRRLAADAAGADATGSDAPPADAPAVADALLADAICDGTIRAIAADLRDWLAADAARADADAARADADAARGGADAARADADAARADADAALAAAWRASVAGSVTADPPTPERFREIARLRAAYDALVATTVTHEATAAVLREHSIDWTLVEYDALVLDGDGPAREARLCIRDDGTSVAALAERLGLDAERGGVYLDAAPPDLAAALIAAETGSVLGPLSDGDRYRVLRVREKRAPDPRDGRLAERAKTILIESALSAHSAGRLEWHGAY